MILDYSDFPNLPDIPEVPHIPAIPEIPTIPENIIEISQIEQASRVASGVIDTIIDLDRAFCTKAAELIQSIGNAVQTYWTTTMADLADKALQLLESLEKLELPTLTDEEAELLVESNRIWGQYGWTYIPSMPISMYDTPPANIKEANKIAMQYCSTKEMHNLFEELKKWKLNHKDLESAIICYKTKQYKACALLLCGMIDSKLIRIQSDDKRPVGARAVNKIKATYENSGEKILAEAMFTYNLLAYLETLFSNGHGFKSEPETLNRNYIGHGMNQRSVRKRDCIQLFLALNNVLQFLELNKE